MYSFYMIHNSKTASNSKKLKTKYKDRIPKAKNSGNIDIRRAADSEFVGFVFAIFDVIKRKTSRKVSEKIKNC